MADVATTNAFLNSPFNTNALNGGRAMYPPLESVPIPSAGAYDNDTAAHVKMTNRQRLESLYNKSNTTFAYTNPADGAVITIAPNYVAARSMNTSTILYDRKADAYDYIEDGRTLSARADGVVQAKENGNTVTAAADGQVTATAANGQHAVFSATTFDAKKDLVGNGYLSPVAASNFARVKHDKSLGKLPEIQRTFNQSTINALYTAQEFDARSKAAPAS